MFFIGIMGLDAAVKPLGEASVDCCPACGRAGRMNLIARYNYFHFFFLPIFKWNKHFLATCPSCASVLELSPEASARLRHRERLSLRSDELRVARDNSVGLCPGCGSHNPPGSAFCNRCGRAL